MVTTDQSPLRVRFSQNNFPNNEKIPLTYTPAPTNNPWSEETRNDSPQVPLDQYRISVGIFIFTATIQFDSAKSLLRDIVHGHRTILRWIGVT